MGRSETRVSPHVFKPLRWWDDLHLTGRCRHCYLPRYGHPVPGWAAARPLGDTSRPTILHDLPLQGAYPDAE